MTESPTPSRAYGEFRAGGKEGQVFVDQASGVATKVYHNSSFRDVAERYFASLVAAEGHPQAAAVTTPKAYSIDPEVPLIRMELCPGVRLDDWIAGDGYSQSTADGLAARIWLGMSSITDAVGTACYDLWGDNTLYDPGDDKLTFLDLDSGDEFPAMKTATNALRSAGGFVGYALYDISRPSTVIRWTVNARIQRFCRSFVRAALMDYPNAAPEICQAALAVFRDCIESGGGLREGYYRTIGQLSFRQRAAGIFSSTRVGGRVRGPLLRRIDRGSLRNRALSRLARQGHRSSE